MSSLLISLLTGAVGAFVTLILTPWMQHFFWTLARRAEIRLAAIIELNSLWGTFLHFAINRDCGIQEDLPKEFFWKLDSTTAQIKALFRPECLLDLEQVQSMIGHDLKHGATIDQFVTARQVALIALYRASGLEATSSIWNRLLTPIN